MSDPRPPGPPVARPNERPWHEAVWARYALAVASVVAATLLMFALYNATGLERGSAPFIFYFCAVVLSATYFGRGPGILSIVLSALTAHFFFLPPFDAFGFDFPTLLQTGVFVFVSLFISALADRGVHAEAVAAESRESMRTTLRSIGDAVISTDGAGRVVFMNPVAERLTGWALDDARGRALAEVFPIVNERTRETVESPVDKVLREGRVVGLANHTVLLARDGREIPIDDSGAPIRDAHGRTTGVVLVFHDITERRAAESAIRESEGRFRALADTAPVMIWMSDPARASFYFNKPWLDFTGLTLERMTGDGWAESIHPEDIESSGAVYAAAFDAREPFKTESRVRRHDGEYRWVLSHGVPRYSHTGEFLGFVGSSIDIHERKEAEAEHSLLAAIVESSQDAVIGKTLDGTVTSWNASAERMYGHTAEEAVGRNISLVVPEDRSDELTEILSRIRRGEGVENLETVRAAKDGARLDVSLTISPVRDASGRLVGASTIARDISAHKRAEEERARLSLMVERERQRLRNLVGDVPGVVWEAWGAPDESGQHIDFVSDHVEKLLGYTVEEWLSTPNFWLSIVHPEDRERAAAEAHAVFESRVGGVSRFRWVGKDGRVVHVEASSTVMLDERGEPAGMRGVTMDITERTRSELTTQFLLEVNEALSRSSDVAGMMGASAGRVGEFFGVDHCAFVEFDREAQTATIRHDWRADAGGVDYTGTYSMADFTTEELRRTLTAGLPVVVEDVAADPRTSHGVEQYRQLGIGSFLNTPYVRGGDLKFALGVYREEPYAWGEDEIRLLRDLTARVWTSIERRRAEEALAESRELLETVANNATLALLIMDAGQQCVYMNPAAERLTGYTLEEVRGRPFHYFVHHTRPDGRPYPLEECPIDRALPQNMREQGEEVFVHRDGTFYPVAFTASPVREGGQAVGTIVEVRDIRDEQRAKLEREQVLARERSLRAEAEAVNRAKDEFLATLSHELRTPLTPILGWTHMIRSGRLGEPEVVRGVRVIERNSQSLSRLINDLLDMSSILSGKMRIEREPVELASVLREAVETVRPQADARRVALEAALGGGGATVSGDRTRLVQVFWNLLNNAVKFSPEGGRVRVSLSADGDGPASVHVEDEGQGIAADFLPHVFERFRQADMGTTREHGGLGIGLALVKSFVEAHGGAVRASSAGEGRGSRFTVTLPALGGGATERESGDLVAGDEAPCAEGVCRVLLIEDAPDTLEMLRVVFESRGYGVVTCADGDEALRVAESGRFDIIVSDIGLPRIDGYELVTRLRGLSHMREVPAVALTGYAAARDAEAAFAAGFDAHVAKPVDPSALVEQIETLMRRRGDGAG
ncbi:MAG TPA: PAS domain S-box protein [Pyrinomonadaceae bacterium]|nr:PAS domain S-box protein [Pyrinomonadaceae bacterium]